MVNDMITDKVIFKY